MAATALALLRKVATWQVHAMRHVVGREKLPFGKQQQLSVAPTVNFDVKSSQACAKLITYGFYEVLLLYGLGCFSSGSRCSVYPHTYHVGHITP